MSRFYENKDIREKYEKKGFPAGFPETAPEPKSSRGTIWLFSFRFPYRLPTEKALAFALAHQIMKLIPLEYSTTSSGKKRAKLLSKREREEIGEYIRKSLESPRMK